MTEPLEVTYGLTRVHIESFSEVDAGPAFSDDARARPVGYAFNVGAALDESRAEVTVTVFLAADLAQENDPTVEAPPDAVPALRIGELVASCTFHVPDLDTLRVDERTVVPGNLMATFVGISISTARGLLIGRSRQRVLGEAPFPVLSPLDAVEELCNTESGSWIGPIRRPS